MNERAAVQADRANAMEESTMISVLAKASEGMLKEAYAAFSLRMPDEPPPDMLECKGCAPRLAAQKRTRAKPTPCFA
jgi:hypothetical protein